MKREPGGLILLCLAVVLGLLLLAPPVGSQPVEERTYSQLLHDLHAGLLLRGTISGQTLIAENIDGTRYQVTLPGKGAEVQSLMLANGVGLEFVSAGGSPGLMSALPWLLPLLAVGGLLWLVHVRNTGSGSGQLFSFTESRARLYLPSERRVTMRDVAGMAEVKEELAEVVDFLRSPERYLELGARIPKGILLSGPPGTGKTLLARAVAGEADVPFFAISGSDFVEIFAGVGASRVRALFVQARERLPCIIFIDEIDAVGRRRGQGVGSGNDEREQTLNQLLVEMDGFSTDEGIIIMAATNRLDTLDPAILRPGRFDRQIQVDLPDRGGRREILHVHAMGKPLAPEVDLDRIAGLTCGFTGADLANLLNEAALVAARLGRDAIGMLELRSAYERVVAGGPALRRGLSQGERLRVAFHEAGHAVVASQLPHADRVEKISLVGRGRGLGYVLYQPREERQLHTRAELADRIVALLGGRAAEEVVLGEVSSGAADDMERSSQIARQMVAELGMCQAIGPIHLAQAAVSAMGGVQGVVLSDRMALAADVAVRNLVDGAYARALHLVRAQRDRLERVAYALLEHESLEGEALERLLA